MDLQAVYAEISALKALLCESDYIAVKIAEGAAAREDYAEIIARRAIWRAKINECEAIIAERTIDLPAS